MTKDINFWKETRSGLRSSATMFTGVVLAAISSLLYLSLPFITENPSTLDTMTSVVWLIWIISLWFLGIAFIWVANHPALGPFGTVVGAFHLIQGTFLLVLLFSTTGAVVPPLIFTVGRLMTILLFGLIEREVIGVPLSILLWVSALLQLLKISLRVMDVLPDMSDLVQNSLDTAFLLFVCIALVQLGKLMHSLENSWAEEKYMARSSGFSDFNNPEHKWDN